MLDNCSYNKIKLLHELSCLLWFLEKHAIKDAENAGDRDCVELLTALQRDLNKHLEKLNKSVCTVLQ